jgi:hypothetical protein
MTLDEALRLFHAEFPGWCGRSARCHVSCDATIAPDRYGLDEDLLQYRTFDNGFPVDLRQPSTVADAMLTVMAKARTARREFRAKTDAAAALEATAVAEQSARWPTPGRVKRRPRGP